MKRILLFLATNLAVVLVLSVVLNIVYAVTGMQPGSLSGLLVMAAVVWLWRCIYFTADVKKYGPTLSGWCRH